MTPEGPVVVAVTASVPFSQGEEVFVQDELSAMLGSGATLFVVPMRTPHRQPNTAAVASGLAARTLGHPLVAGPVLLGALRTLGRRPMRTLRTVSRALLSSGNLRNLGVNLASIPKALWLVQVIRDKRAEHVHAYWLAHTSTAAMIGAEIAGVSWSGTAYRWDIDAANGLTAKLRSAAFIRCADELGHRQLTGAAGAVSSAAPVVLVRTGVAVPDRAEWADRPVGPDILCCPAAFVEKKGHTVLLRAVRQLIDGRPDLHLHLFGDGPLRSAIQDQVTEWDLVSHTTLHGNIPLDDLRSFLRRHRPICVLPSIRAADGQEEGIPVTLVEALANGAPVVSTRSGSIETLIVDGCGLLVPPGDAEALAAAISAVAADPGGAATRCDAGYERLLGEFDLKHTGARMMALQRTAVAGERIAGTP